MELRQDCKSKATKGCPAHHGGGAFDQWITVVHCWDVIAPTKADSWKKDASQVNGPLAGGPLLSQTLPPSSVVFTQYLHKIPWLQYLTRYTL